MQQGGEGWGSGPDAQGLQILILLLLSLERITLVGSGHAAGKGGVGKFYRWHGTPKLCSLLLPSHEGITLVESGHAVGRGGVGKLSRRPETPNFVPCFFLLTRE